MKTPETIQDANSDQYQMLVYDEDGSDSSEHVLNLHIQHPKNMLAELSLNVEQAIKLREILDRFIDSEV